MVRLDDRDVSTYGPDHSPGWPITFSGDGSVVAYRVTDFDKEESCVAVNGREGPSFPSVGPPSLSRDGRVCAYWVEREDRYFIRIGDREEPPCDFVVDPIVSADGSTVAYAGERQGRWFMKVGSVESPLPGKPHKVFLSPDGGHAGWVQLESLPAGGSKMRVNAFGRTGEAFGLVNPPVFSPTQPLVAYGAEDEKRKYVVIGERKIETPDRVNDPVFSPDGRTVGYGARIGNELWWKVLNVP